MKKFILTSVAILLAMLFLPTGNASAQSIYRKDNLVAWCIVPFDSVHRTPKQRIEMLKKLGIKRYAYDWRAEHLTTTAEEWQLAKQNNIGVHAVWLWIDENTDKVDKLGEVNEKIFQLLKDAKLKTELWVGFNGNFFENLSDDEKIKKGVAMLQLLKKKADALKCKVALYNHGDWFGDPENEVKIIKASGLKDIGIIYNFHHAHEQLDRYEQIIKATLPYLFAVNLDGMRVEGPKILPLGQGDRELEMMKFLKASGYKGPIGILGHVENADVEQVLQQNLAGMVKLLEQMKDADALKTYGVAR